MRRRSLRPFGASAPSTRLWSMILALALMWMMYDRMRDPLMWRWFSPHSDEVLVAETAPGEQPGSPRPAAADQLVEPSEEVVPGPNDQDEAAVKEIRAAFEGVVDKTKILSRDMEAYWQLMQWARTQTTAELEKRATRDVAFTHIFDQPDRYRGKLIQLRMHVRRVLVHEEPENTLGLKQVYELWGWTDESKSFPYVVVIPELPKGLPVGTDIRAEVMFTGYFLKVMAYQAFEAKRGAPLLIGRAHTVMPKAIPVSAKVDPWTTLPVVLVVAVALILMALVTRKQNRRATSINSLPAELPGVSLPGDLSGGFGSPAEHSAGVDLFSQASAHATAVMTAEPITETMASAAVATTGENSPPVRAPT